MEWPSRTMLSGWDIPMDMWDLVGLTTGNILSCFEKDVLESHRTVHGNDGHVCIAELPSPKRYAGSYMQT